MNNSINRALKIIEDTISYIDNSGPGKKPEKKIKYPSLNNSWLVDLPDQRRLVGLDFSNNPVYDYEDQVPFSPTDERMLDLLKKNIERVINSVADEIFCIMVHRVNTPMSFGDTAYEIYIPRTRGRLNTSPLLDLINYIKREINNRINDASFPLPAEDSLALADSIALRNFYVKDIVIQVYDYHSEISFDDNIVLAFSIILYSNIKLEYRIAKNKKLADLC